MKKLLLLLLCFSLTLSAQEKKAKPKVGVVLSGGGAKGLAHIGVLKVLEEAGVEVSYIGGTSMGAIVGGLYAAGYSAKELDSIFRGLDADALLKDFTPRENKNFFEKRNDEMYALQLPFQGFRIGVPTALSKGLYNYTTVNQLTDHVRHIRDFKELPIPFVCIATDVETGEEVVLSRGVLADAILASGAFPSLYNPVLIDGRLLIDGGVTNNYPIEEVKKMGADIVIGVDVQDPLRKRDQIKGAMGILAQINNYQMIQKMEAKRNATDIYIKPDISGFSVVSFEDGESIIKQGEEAALNILPLLEQLGNGKPIEKHHENVQDTLYIEQIRINGLEHFTRSYVIGKLNFKPGNYITYEDLNKGLSTLNATQNYTSMSYCFEKGEKKGEILKLTLQENPVTRYIKFSLHYDPLYKSALLVNLTQKKLMKKNDVVSLDIALGDNTRYNIDYYIDNGYHISYGIRSYCYGFNRNISTDYSTVSLLDVLGVESMNVDFKDFTNQLFFQTVFAQRFLIGAGAEYKHIKIKSNTAPGINPIFDDSDYASAFGYLKFDSLDDKYFPTEGYYFSGEAKAFLYSSDYTGQFSPFTLVKGEIGTAKTLFKGFTLNFQGETGMSFGENVVPTFNFVLGGYGYYATNNFRHFYGYDFMSLGGNSYIKGLISADYEFYRRHHLNLSANYANVGNNLYEEGKMLSLPQYSGYALGYGFETILGPLEIKHSWSPETNKHFTWVSVGFWF